MNKEQTSTDPRDFYKIGILGDGYVGGSIRRALQMFDYSVMVFDPKYGDGNKFEDILDTNVLFVCVPTPMDNNGYQDISILHNVLAKLERMHYKGLVVIKSTVSPMNINVLWKELQFSSFKMVTNPEFLSERTALTDFLNTRWVFLGVQYATDAFPLISIYQSILSKDVEYRYVSIAGAMMLKMMCNTLFATKVALMNEFYHMWVKMFPKDSWNENHYYSDWNTLIEAFAQDTRVGEEHLQVPGPDGHFGFGGSCFPKDLNAMITQAELLGVPHNVMSGAWTTNLEVREDRNWEHMERATGKKEVSDEVQS